MSKLLFVFSTPIFWIAVLFALGIFLKNKKLKRKLLVTGFAVFYFFSNSFVFDEIVRRWEPEMNKVDPGKKYELAIVLGGYSTYAPRAGQINFSNSSDRLNAVLPLYFSHKVKKILLSGGAGNLFDFTKPEAEYAADYLIEIGVKPKDIIVEPNSRNTYQNAVEAKRVLDSLNITEPVLLITSTTHMQRSALCFEKQNILHDKYLVDGITGERKFYFDHLFIPNAGVLLLWNVIFHEWLGLLTYKISGYI